MGVSLVEDARAISELEKQRDRLIKRCARQLLRAIPPAFPKNFRSDQFITYTYPQRDGIHTFTEWVSMLLHQQKLTLLFTEALEMHAWYPHECGWRGLSDAEVAFEALAQAWKGLVSIELEAQLDARVKKSPPILSLTVRFTLR